jgi:hypothetical protein
MHLPDSLAKPHFSVKGERIRHQSENSASTFLYS